jgi:hypothetical protein
MREKKRVFEGVAHAAPLPLDGLSSPNSEVISSSLEHQGGSNLKRETPVIAGGKTSQNPNRECSWPSRKCIGVALSTNVDIKRSEKPVMPFDLGPVMIMGLTVINLYWSHVDPRRHQHAGYPDLSPSKKQALCRNVNARSLDMRPSPFLRMQQSCGSFEAARIAGVLLSWCLGRRSLQPWSMITAVLSSQQRWE